MADKQNLGRAARAAAQQLESLGRAGVTHLPKAKRKVRIAPAAKPSAAPKPAAAQSPAAQPTAAQPTAAAERPAISTKPLKSVKDRVAALEIIRDEVAGCTSCHELATTRTQTVFGVGNPQARLCFVGEAPGADEDRQGEPFVGRAGQLLTRIIEGGCGMSRQDVYILNVLKCRPPGNRTPLPPEVANCRGFLDRQLEVIRPEYICCLGGVAAQTLLETEQTIGKLRGVFHHYQGIPVVCTYHPAYLLRNPAAKRDVWEDLKMLLKAMGLKVPKGQQP